VLRISGKCSFQDYWDDPRFAMKKPFFRGSQSRAYGDNIYHHDEHGRWVQERSHHSFADGSMNEANLFRDIGSDSVLWSEDFAYFGRAASPIPDHLRAFDGDDLYPTGRSHRVGFSTAFVAAIETWFQQLPARGYLARPAAWP